jgi:Sialic acid synthase
VGVATPSDPCLIPPSGGYRGLENRTYRVEIHDGGEIGDATFKWSRDNASVASGVSAIENDITLTVDRAVWDSVRSFSPGDWVEITDDWREFSLRRARLRQIDSVNDSSRTITLKSALTAGLFPGQRTKLNRPRATHANQTLGPGSRRSEVIEVPASGTPFILEDGVEITFTTDPGGGAFRSGDYWVFVARTADASVEDSLRRHRAACIITIAGSR